MQLEFTEERGFWMPFKELPFEMRLKIGGEFVEFLATQKERLTEKQFAFLKKMREAGREEKGTEWIGKPERATFEAFMPEFSEQLEAFGEFFVEAKSPWLQ